jgi:cyclase
LVKGRGLVKTVCFASPKYVGDPINAVRIFNEKEVDELIVLDIDATTERREPDYTMIEHLASECRMPLCYGGGVKSIEQAQRIIGFGVEKIAISSAAVLAPRFVTDLAERVGAQSVVAVLDVRRAFPSGPYEVWLWNGLENTHKRAAELAADLEGRGAGEVVINSIENDGVMRGYDIDLAKEVRSATTVPLTMIGGAGSLEHIRELICNLGVVGAAAGSLFVFKGVHKAVLINYPSRLERDALLPTQA